MQDWTSCRADTFDIVLKGRRRELRLIECAGGCTACSSKRRMRKIVDLKDEEEKCGDGTNRVHICTDSRNALTLHITTWQESISMIVGIIRQKSDNNTL